MPETKQINVNANIIDGEEIFAHETSINFNPLQFTFDFKCITPRIDPRANPQDGQAQILIRHNIVMMEPFHAKMFADMINQSLKKYEQEFGTIEKPKALAVLEKKLKGSTRSVDKSLSYLG